MKSTTLLAAPCLLLLSQFAWSAPQVTEAAPAKTTEELPAARTVIDRHLELTGAAVLSKTTSMRVKGKLEVVGMGVGGPMEVLSHKSNKRLIQVDMGAMGKIREGFDGTTAWSIQPGAGANVQEGLERLQTVLHANYASPLKRQGDYESIRTVARAEFEGKACWKLELVAKLPAGADAESTRPLRTTHEYYDIESGLLAGTEMTAANLASVVVIPSEYKKLGERLVATSVLQKAGPQQYRITTDSITYDDVQPAAFTLPAEVDAKLKALKEAAPGDAK